jgi:hypothetical protein
VRLQLSECESGLEVEAPSGPGGSQGPARPFIEVDVTRLETSLEINGLSGSLRFVRHPA